MSSWEAINGLLTEAVYCLDNNKLEDWAELFAEDGVYRVVPRENLEQGLSGVLIVCNNRNMVRDRVTALREACEFNIHWDRHVTGSPRIKPLGGNLYAVESSYSLYQTDPEGESKLYSVGCYRDKIALDGETAQFKERLVVVDTFAIPNLLATPI